ncbi:Com family DNA-binding transcriptional regulator [Pseudomonas sp. WS 5079]|uniref:Com family DNA-binding transcriptional regulator n=1 Tax=Pseudomonas sp. WS 5079 TaxID=2717492 RepID=UPI00155797DA|nr:Com family DNA-binding transcriptional regulator [Pseudomonas sp. WS 5079]NMX60183.1 Com family DNA-binding transcriptional regulator [Pseudomonas sp. WS 5079]
MMQEIRCGQCGRKLAAVSGFIELQIKCPRCRTLNHLKAESLLISPSSAQGLQEATCTLNRSSPG